MTSPPDWLVAGRGPRSWGYPNLPFGATGSENASTPLPKKGEKGHGVKGHLSLLDIYMQLFPPGGETAKGGVCCSYSC